MVGSQMRALTKQSGAHGEPNQMTKKSVILFFIVITMLALAGSAFAKKAPVVLSPEQINLSVTRAVAGIPALRSAMLDPDSFVLENVTVKAPNKQGVI